MNKTIRRILLIVCICVFAYSAYSIGSIFYSYWKVDNDNNTLASEVIENKKADSALKRKVDFKKLNKINEDIIGWIYIPHTEIDYPLLKGKNNDSYIHTNYKKNYSFAGCIFADEISSRTLTDDNTIIYGHNMKNGSMFAGIKKFVSLKYMNKHPNVYIYLPNGTVNAYNIFSANVINVASKLYCKGIDYNKYIQQIFSSGCRAKKSVSRTQAPLIMLSTCHAAHAVSRNVIYARLEKNVKAGN